MSTIYDNNKNKDILRGNSEEFLPDTREVSLFSNKNDTEIISYQERSHNAMNLVDDIVLRNYLSKLESFDIEPIPGDLSKDEIILFKINKMVYEKDEYATDKFMSIVSSMTYTNSSIYLIVDGHKDHTDFFLGIKCQDDKREKSTIAETFKNSLLGQFPGIKLEDYSFIQAGAKSSQQDKLLNKISDAVSVSSCVGIPSYKNSKGEYTNANFIQGIEKFATAMQGKVYTAIVLAQNSNQDEIINLRRGYESIYTDLSAMASKQLAYSTNESLANAISETKGFTDSTNTSTTLGTSESHGTSFSTTKTKGTSEENEWAKASKIGGSIISMASPIATAVAMGAVAASPVAAGVLLAGGAISAIGALGAKTITESTADNYGTSTTHTKNESKTEGTSHSESFSETYGKTTTTGSSKNITITIQNKSILEIQKRIDKQLERIALSESTGLWQTGAYFMSYDTDRSTAETAATIFRSIMQGEQSGVETSAINTWYDNTGSKLGYSSLLKYISSLSHPIFRYHSPILDINIPLSSVSLLSSKEVAIMLGLPRKSVPGLPVIEHISLGKEVVMIDNKKNENSFELGCIFDQGITRESNKVFLDVKSLTKHTFVTGSTGSGKSNTVYHLINQIRNQSNAPKFLIIEPAKGEYKNVFGDVNVYGTNPQKTPILRINPFKFPKGVHVLEHIDRLIEIFNVCWPMYAAMPAVLKEAILNCYENCGWDLYNSENIYSDNLFPNFIDLQNELVSVINNSAYSDEIKSNYQGALVTRVKSLNNGIYKEIFSSQELGDEALFDENVIVDLSRVGSQETKSFIMGILIMRLSEYRANSDIPHNSELRHITILEEAHNLLKRVSQEQSSEGNNIAGKSVEMISNAIAEMRTYGEGFIIVDQSPGAVDISAIRNTNTKIIMRLPEYSDRKVAGKASGMKDNQVDEIAKLPTGVAVVYQNDWEEPVLCKINKFEEKEISFKFVPERVESKQNSKVITEILKMLLNGRFRKPIEFNIETIEQGLEKLELSTINKRDVYEALKEYRANGEIEIWNDNNYIKLSKLVADIISGREEILYLTKTFKDHEALTKQLEELVYSKIGNIQEYSENFLLTIYQCLMRDYSLISEKSRQDYLNWFQSSKK